MLVLTLISLAAWIYLLGFRQDFWRADQKLAHQRPRAPFPKVVAVVPARNEAESIEACLRALRAQQYDGAFEIVLVDDSSTDDTGDLARSVAAEPSGAPVTVFEAAPLEAGWSGKLWALDQGLASAQADSAEYFWFTDADIVHAPDTLSHLVAKAQADQRALVSLMVKLHCKTTAERFFMPAFVFFFQKLYPFPAINDPASPVAGAAGGCVLLEASALEDIGGLQAMHDALIDDCTLAQKVKAQGRSIWLGLGETSYSLREYQSLADVWPMVTRTAFTQLNYSILLLLGTVAGMGLIYLMGPTAALWGFWTDQYGLAVIGLSVWVLQAVAFAPTLAYYGQPRVLGVLLPLIAVLYTIMTLDSARLHVFAGGARWKARDYRQTG